MIEAKLETAVNTAPIVKTDEVPGWAISEIGDAYDLRTFDAADPINGETRVIISSGPRKLDAEILQHLPSLEYIIACGSGCEGIDRAYARERGIIVSNSAIITAEDVADHAVSITLTLYSRTMQHDHAIRSDNWHIPTRRSLRELNIGVFGLGAIGLAIIQRMTAFGCDQIRWSGPRPKDTRYPYMADLGDLAEWADILFVAARADASNRNLIGDAIFDKLGPQGLISNISRGSIIDEDALIAALKAGRLGGAALDVFQSEPTPAERWRDIPNAVLTPHVGGHATGVKRGIGQLIRKNLDRFFAGEQPLGIIEIKAG